MSVYHALFHWNVHDGQANVFPKLLSINPFYGVSIEVPSQKPVRRGLGTRGCPLRAATGSAAKAATGSRYDVALGGGARV